MLLGFRVLGRGVSPTTRFVDIFKGFRLWRLRFRGLGFRVWGLGFGVWGHPKPKSPNPRSESRSHSAESVNSPNWEGCF